MIKEDFHTAFAQANLLYGYEDLIENFEEIGLIAWNKIGNKDIKLYRYRTNVDKETNSIELPCNCTEIEAITLDWEDWNYTSNQHVNGDYNSSFTESYIESRKLFKNKFYTSGSFVKYEQVGNIIYFDKDIDSVNILYKGVIVDDTGLPYLNEKEKDAIACYCAYTKRFKEGWLSHNQGMLQEALLLEQRWLKLCDAARIPLSISQNEVNEILDAKTNWNRKIFNKSFKPVK